MLAVGLCTAQQGKSKIGAHCSVLIAKPCSRATTVAAAILSTIDSMLTLAWQWRSRGSGHGGSLTEGLLQCVSPVVAGILGQGLWQ